jgi:hypothetical protein
MIMRALGLACLSVVLIAVPVAAQVPSAAADTMLSGAALRADVRVLKGALEAIHPGLYRYTSPSALDRRFADLETRLASGASLSEAYVAFAELLGTLRCGHTFPNPVNQSRAVAEAVFRRTPRVPFYFRWLDGRMIVTRDASPDRAFPAGTEILAINGTPAAGILARLLPYSRTDGGNEAKRVANLAVSPGARWQAFDVYFPLVFPPPSGAWSYRVRTPAGRTRVVTSPPVGSAQRTATYDSLARADRDTATPPWTLRVDGELAVLAMPTWVTYNDAWDWEGFIDRAFAELAARRVPTLVIDLRGNEGGTSVGDAILAHLIDRPLLLGQLQRFTRYRAAPAGLRPYLDTWDRSFDDWGAAASPSADRPGYFRLVRSGDDTAGSVVRPALPRYTGRVFALVGADNSSATFEFALALREHRLGTLVGQPTGGNQRGINGGAFYFLRLPNSKIEVDLPIIGFFPQRARPDAGIEPDVPVRVTTLDVARGRDPELAAVRRLVRRAAPPRPAATGRVRPASR